MKVPVVLFLFYIVNILENLCFALYYGELFGDEGKGCIRVWELFTGSVLTFSVP